MWRGESVRKNKPEHLTEIKKNKTKQNTLCWSSRDTAACPWQHLSKGLGLWGGSRCCPWSLLSFWLVLSV